MVYHNLSRSVGDLASMETLSVETQDDGSGANPSSVKSDDSSTPQESGRGSPPPNCAICLGTCRNKCFTDSCLHQFCFKCLLTWSKVKAECPLCKQNFRSIIHNVRSNHQYEEYLVEQRQTEGSPEQAGLDNFSSATRRFRYRTTLTLPRHETIAIQQLLMHYPMVAGVFPQSRAPAARRRSRSPAAFRRTVYRHNLWARPLPDFTGRFRDCTPDFYRYNDSQMHRLVPWLTRELHYLLDENINNISYVVARILELLKQYHVSSAEFMEEMQAFFGDRTEHFLHELYCFASTPYDMTGYDRNVQYTTETRISSIVNEVLSSSDSEASVDSDIVMVSSSGPAEPPPGPSRLPVPVYPQHRIPPPAAPADGVVPIETISHSGSDDDDEVMVVGYIKPPRDRTPEVVDLLGSDSDVIVQDSAPPEPAPALATASASAPAPLVKLSLKRARHTAGSDSDSSYCPPTPPPPRPRRRRRRSALSASTASTASSRRDTDAPTTASSRSPSPPCPPCPPCPPDPAAASTSPTPTSTTTTTTTTTTDIDSSDDHRRRTPKKSRRKSTRQHVEKDKKKSKKSASRSHKNRKTKIAPPENTKRSKRKSHSGKGVKSSKRSESDSAPAERGSAAAAATGEPAPSTSGARPAPADRDRRRRRPSRDRKRLKSVVNVMSQKNSSDSSSSGNSNLLNILSSAILKPNSSVLAYNSDSGSAAGSERRCGAARALLQQADACLALRPASPAPAAAPVPAPAPAPASAARSASPARSAATDSDDDLPLNLSVHKTYTKL